MNVVQTQATSVRPLNKKFTRTSIGRKIFMAISGLILFGFVVGHMIGNLQIFLGQEQLNAYAQALKDLPVLTYTVRTVLLVLLIVHVWLAVRLYLENRASRPVGYVYEDTVQASLASRTMIWTGLGVFLYVVYHLLHFTFIVTNPQYEHLVDAAGRHDVYSMVVLSFQNYLISAVYIVALFLVTYHLSHALFSLFQTLGLNNPRIQPALKRTCTTIAVVIFIGYASIPVAVLLNIVTLPAGGH
jgi:succinate dehydrogenase / fumarate reductase cytochrome b subunit